MSPNELQEIKRLIEDANKRRDSDVCPSCGHCKHCGHGAAPWYPVYPYYQQPYYQPWPATTTITCGPDQGTTSGTFFIGDNWRANLMKSAD